MNNSCIYMIYFYTKFKICFIETYTIAIFFSLSHNSRSSNNFLPMNNTWMYKNFCNNFGIIETINQYALLWMCRPFVRSFFCEFFEHFSRVVHSYGKKCAENDGDKIFFEKFAEHIINNVLIAKLMVFSL